MRGIRLNCPFLRPGLLNLPHDMVRDEPFGGRPSSRGRESPLVVPQGLAGDCGLRSEELAELVGGYGGDRGIAAEEALQLGEGVSIVRQCLFAQPAGIGCELVAFQCLGKGNCHRSPPRPRGASKMCDPRYNFIVRLTCERVRVNSGGLFSI